MLNRIEVRNFKSFKHLAYKCVKLNLLTGLNGAGKSSFVQLMLLLRGSAREIAKPCVELDLREMGIANSFSDIRYCYAPKDEATTFSVDFPVRYLTENGEEIDGPEQRSVRRNLTESTTSRGSILVWHPDALKKQSQFETEVNETIDRCHEGKISEEELDAITQKSENELSAAFAGIERNQEQIQRQFKNAWRRMMFVGAFRKRPHEVHDGREFSLGSLIFGSREEFDPEGGDVVEFLYKIGSKLRLRESHPMCHPHGKLLSFPLIEGKESLLIDQVNAWLDEISPGAKINIKSESVGDEEKFVESVDFGEGDLLRAFKPQNVGFGISYILPVLVTLLTARPEDIVIIENPEAHLHPRGQSEMGRLIACAAASGVQLFVETHSDHIINGVRVAIKEGVIMPDDAKVAFFERRKHTIPSEDGKDSVEVYTSERDILIDKNGALSEYPTDFLDEWNNQLMELM